MSKNFRVAIFIDGGYLDSVLMNNQRARIDYSKMCEELKGDLNLLRTYYYHCLPYQSPTPTPQESSNFANAEKFQSKLNRLDSFTVRRGKLAFRGINTNGDPIYEQKRVDTFLATDLVMHSTKRLITHALLITGDSDFIPAVDIAQSEGVHVTLCYSAGSFPHDELIDAVDQRLEITPDMINNWKR